MSGKNFFAVLQIKKFVMRNAARIIVFSAFVFIALLTGFISGIKVVEGVIIFPFNNFSIEIFLIGGLGSGELLFSRLFSCLLILGCAALSVLWRPLIFCAYLLVLWRAFCFGVSLAIVFLSFGVVGVVTAVVCLAFQILSFFLFLLFFSYLKNSCSKKLGVKGNKGFLKVLAIMAAVCLVVCAVETFVLMIISSNFFVVI